MRLGRGLLGTLGWSDGSFSLPQDDIDESADQRQREGHPRQDVGIAEGVCLRHPVRTHHRVDDGSAHHEQTWGRGGRSEQWLTPAAVQSDHVSRRYCARCLASPAEACLAAEASGSVFPRRRPSALHHGVSCLLNTIPASHSSSARLPGPTWHDLFVGPPHRQPS